MKDNNRSNFRLPNKHVNHEFDPKIIISRAVSPSHNKTTTTTTAAAAAAKRKKTHSANVPNETTMKMERAEQRKESKMDSRPPSIRIKQIFICALRFLTSFSYFYYHQPHRYNHSDVIAKRALTLTNFFFDLHPRLQIKHPSSYVLLIKPSRLNQKMEANAPSIFFLHPHSLSLSCSNRFNM